MKKLLTIMLACHLISCVDSADQQDNDGKTEEKQEIFPAAAYLSAQVHEVDSLQLPVLKYTTINGITDTVLISLDEFKALAQEFTEPDISQPPVKSFYKESSFADQSIPSVTMTYSTSNKELEVQRMDVIIRPNPILNDKVKSIYIEKFRERGDTSIVKKLFWTASKNFLIVTSKQVNGRPPLVTQLKVVWDNTE